MEIVDTISISKTGNKKTAAKISLMVLLLLISSQLLQYFKINYQLQSPLIPNSTILLIAEPYIKMAFVFTVACILALLFYFYSRFLLTIIISALSVIFLIVYLYL